MEATLVHPSLDLLAANHLEEWTKLISQLVAAAAIVLLEAALTGAAVDHDAAAVASVVSIRATPFAAGEHDGAAREGVARDFACRDKHITAVVGTIVLGAGRQLGHGLQGALLSAVQDSFVGCSHAEDPVRGLIRRYFGLTLTTASSLHS